MEGSMAGVNVGADTGMSERLRDCRDPRNEKEVRGGRRQINRLLSHAYPSSTSSVF